MSVKRRTYQAGISRNDPYYLLFGISFLGGLWLYHVLGKQIDSIWNRVPYLKNVRSHYGEEEEEEYE